MNEAKKIGRDALQQCRKILNAPKDSTFYDLNMNDYERGVLLRAAGLPDATMYRQRKFAAWNDTDRRKLKEAAKRASGWANGLQVA
jgi:hypothetical protein